MNVESDMPKYTDYVLTDRNHSEFLFLSTSLAGLGKERIKIIDENITLHGGNIAWLCDIDHPERMKAEEYKSALIKKKEEIQKDIERLQ